MEWDTDFTGAARLKRARHFQRLTQDALARAFGVSAMTVLRWENEEGVPAQQYRKVVDGFIHNAERIMASQLAPRARFSPLPVTWIGGRITHAR